MFKHALAGLDKLGPEAGVYTNQQDKQRIAGALAVQAKLNRPPLPEIQDIIPSQTNGNVFAAYKTPGNDLDVLRTHVTKPRPSSSPWPKTCRNPTLQISGSCRPLRKRHRAQWINQVMARLECGEQQVGAQLYGLAPVAHRRSTRPAIGPGCLARGRCSFGLRGGRCRQLWMPTLHRTC
ncbi:XVIPCD domain-containing protein [Xanthomonas phaseoli]|uniref:XVIPCD domain-containing protein n=1 Tax=Xanthomonas phaseoli TaxID=1985254 RepID=UPI002868FEA8|nr:XVIPCD domain-containing protein [Xanthomonas phaseoli]